MQNSSSSYMLAQQELLDLEKKRLLTQAREFFKSEGPVIRKLIDVPPKRILELGCGNSIYLNLLMDEFPEATGFGIDRNKALIDQGREMFSRTKLYEINLCDRINISNKIKEISPDVVVLRFVLQHMNASERKDLLEDIFNSLEIGARLIVVDVDDTQISYSKEATFLKILIDRKMNMQAADGGDRGIGRGYKEFFISNDWSSAIQKEVDVGSSSLSWEQCESIFLPIYGGSISKGLTEIEKSAVEEFKAWLAQPKKGSNHFLKYPLFITIAQK